MVYCVIISSSSSSSSSSNSLSRRRQQNADARPRLLNRASGEAYGGEVPLESNVNERAASASVRTNGVCSMYYSKDDVKYDTRLGPRFRARNGTSKRDRNTSRRRSSVSAAAMRRARYRPTATSAVICCVA